MKWPSKFVVIFGLLLVFAAAAAKDTESQFKSISRKLVCRCGCNYLLADCPHLECPSAIPMRKQIRGYLQQGVNEQAILAAMVKEHGMAVLAAPPAKGFNLAAWIIPFAALGVGFVIVRQVLLRMRARAQAQAAASTAQTEALKPYEQRLEEEIRALEDETAAKTERKA